MGTAMKLNNQKRNSARMMIDPIEQRDTFLPCCMKVVVLIYRLMSEPLRQDWGIPSVGYSSNFHPRVVSAHFTRQSGFGYRQRPKT